MDAIGDDNIEEKQEEAVEVIVKILEHKGISVIQSEYNGVPAIVDDMQRGRKIIVQVKGNNGFIFC